MQTKTFKLIISLSIAILPMQNICAASYDFEVNGIYYTYDMDLKEATVVSGPSHYSGDIVIPDEVKYGRYSFDVTTIGKRAFEDCKNLTSIKLPQKLKTVYEKAFYGCTGLTSLYIPDSTLYIDDYAFANLTNLQEIHLPLIVDVIGRYAFKGLGVKELIIPDTWLGGWTSESLYGYFFYGMTNLEKLTIGAGIEYFSDFDDAVNLKEVIFNGGDEGLLYYVGGFNNSGLDELPKFPKSVKTLSGFGKNHFYNITIPAHVTLLQDFCKNSRCVRKMIFEDSETPLKIDRGSIWLPRIVYFGRDIINGDYLNTNNLETIWFGWDVSSVDFLSKYNGNALKAIFVNSEHPEEVSASFNNLIYANSTLYVPQGMVDSYGSTPGWENFFFIEEQGDMHNLEAEVKVLHSTVAKEPNDYGYYYTYETQGDSIVADVIITNTDGFAFSGPVSVQVNKYNSYHSEFIMIAEKTVEMSLLRESKDTISMVFEGLTIGDTYQLIVRGMEWGSMIYLTESDHYKLRYPDVILSGQTNMTDLILFNNKYYARSGIEQRVEFEIFNNNEVTFNEPLIFAHYEYNPIGYYDYGDGNTDYNSIRDCNFMKVSDTNIPPGKSKTFSFDVNDYKLRNLHIIRVYKDGETDTEDAICRAKFLLTDQWHELSATATVMNSTGVTLENEQQQTLVGENATVSFFFRNDDIMPYNEKIKFVLLSKQGDYLKQMGSLTTDFSIEPGDQTTFDLRCPNLTSGTEYLVEVYYYLLGNETLLAQSEVFLSDQDYIDGIDDITISTDMKIINIVTPMGQRIDKLKNGFNILHMKDGTVRKIWMR